MSTDPEQTVPTVSAAEAESKEEEDDDDEEETPASASSSSSQAGGKSKKKNRKKKKKGGSNQAASALALLAAFEAAQTATGDSSSSSSAAAAGSSKKTAPAPADCLGRAINKKVLETPVPVTPAGVAQTSPPAVPINEFYPEGRFPLGLIEEYPQLWNGHRFTSAELREKEKPSEATWELMREAAEAHRQARQDIQRFIRPGMRMLDIAERVEGSVMKLVRADHFRRGRGFPTGLSINHCAAHWSPNPGDTTVLGAKDVLKVDIGAQVGGRIVDSAFTMHFDPTFDGLVEAVREATMAGVQAAGIDVRLGDVGAAIEEVYNASECEINGKTYRVRAIRNLCGHNIAPFIIHGGKMVPIVASNDATKMEEGEVFAIETFGSTGKGVVVDDGECSHYAKNPRFTAPVIRSAKAKQLLDVIDKNFWTLPFCRRWLDELGEKQHVLGLRQLCDIGALEAYPPLVDVRGSYTAQFEHTILLRPTCKEILSKGDDY